MSRSVQGRYWGFIALAAALTAIWLSGAAAQERGRTVLIAPLGFTAADITPELKDKYSLRFSTGVVVVAADQDSALQDGDQLIEVDGETIRSAQALAEKAAALSPGESLRINGLRGNEDLEVALTAPELDIAPQLPFAEDPMPMIEAGGHSGKIRDVIWRPEDDLLITAGYDKTVRFWSISEKRLLRVLRGPSKVGSPGTVTAIALSPDKQTLAAAGWLYGNIAEESSVRLIDVASGETKDLLPAHSNVVLDLAYSPDGRWIASSGADSDAVIWDARTGQIVHWLRSHSAEVIAVAFTPDSKRLITASYDSTLKIWDVETGAEIAWMQDHAEPVQAIAISPNGLLASGDVGGVIRIWDSQTGASRGVLADQRGSVGMLAFSPSGREIVSTCAFNGCGLTQRVYDLKTGEERQHFPDHNDGVMVAAWINEEMLLTAGGSDHEMDLWERSSGKSAARMVGVGRQMWSVGFSPDGKRVGWGHAARLASWRAADPLEWSMGLAGPEGRQGERLVEGPKQVGLEGEGWIRAILEKDGVRLSHRPGGSYRRKDGTLVITRAGIDVPAITRNSYDGLGHISYTLSPDAQIVVSGGSNGKMYSYGIDGRKLGEFVGHIGDVWGVAVSPDGRLLASASDDQTIRLWNLKSHELILTIFPGSDGSWVAFTPQGYYDASVGGADAPAGSERIGWLLNYGPKPKVDFVTADQLGDKLYRPSLVARAIELGSAIDAITEANQKTDLERPLPGDLRTLFASLPPEMRLLDYGADDEGYLRLVYAVRRFNPDEGPLRLLLDPPDGAEGMDPIALTVARLAVTDEDRTAAGLAPGEELLVLRAPARGGANFIRLRLSNAAGESREDFQAVYVPGEGALAQRGKLRILAIGVADYSAASIYQPLRFTDDDAIAFAQTADEELGRFYVGETEIRLIAGGEGGREPTEAEIRAGLEWLAEAGSYDTTLIFMAGHGRAEEDGDRYLFLPSDYRIEPGAETGEGGIPFVDIWAAVARAPGRKVLFLDACRSANAYGFRLEGQALRAKAGLFSSASFDEPADESEEYGHGYFTYALLEGLRGRAFRNGVLTARGLDAWLARRVPELTDRAQIPPAFRYIRGDMMLGG